MHYYDSENTEKGIFSYNCKSMLKAKEVDGDITKFGYDAYNVLNQIIKPNADEVDFNFDMLGRLREYETSNRESAFDMDGTKRLGDFEDKTDEWRRYHWCKQHLLGYKDDSDTYYFLTEPDGSVEVIFTHGGTTVNRLEYDFLGKIRNQTTTPQVELLWRGMFCNSDDSNNYIFNCLQKYYNPVLGVYFDLAIENNSIEDISGFDLWELNNDSEANIIATLVLIPNSINNSLLVTLAEGGTLSLYRNCGTDIPECWTEYSSAGWRICCDWHDGEDEVCGRWSNERQGVIQ